MARARWMLLLASVPMTWAACSDSSLGSQPATDAGVAAPRDRPPVEQEDLPVDAAPDRRGNETIGDENPFPGSWSHVPGVPAYCDNRLADDPASLASKWIACPSGRTGCRKLDTSWTKRWGNAVEVDLPVDPVRLVNGVPYLKMRRAWPPPKPPGPYIASVDIVEPLDGAPVIAIGSAPTLYKGDQRWCGIKATFGDYGVGFHSWPRDPAIPPSEFGSDTIVLGWAPWSSPSALTVTSWSPSSIDAPTAYFTTLTMGSRGFWLGSVAPESIVSFDVTTKTAIFVQNRAHYYGASSAPGGAIAHDGQAPSPIVFVNESGTPSRLITAASEGVARITLDRSSSDQLVWVEADFPAFDYVNTTLWTSPFATSEAGVVRRKVAKIDDARGRAGGRFVANKGVVLSLVGRNTALVTRLSDGAGWLVQGEPLERFVVPVWVDDNDVLIETAEDKAGTFDNPASGIVRIARASLGAPTVGSGL